MTEIYYNELLSYLNRFCDHCERSQKNYEDYCSTRGIGAYLRELWRGKSKRHSYFSGLCGECSDIISHLRTITAANEELRCYHQEICTIQNACINERCEEALEHAKRLRDKIEKEIFGLPGP